MKKKSFLIIANWKTYLSLTQGITYLEQYGSIWEKIANEKNKKIIICPPFTMLLNAQKELANKHHISLSAQTCSPFFGGAHTGDIDAQSLKELGCSHIIVGHPEQRHTYNLKNDFITQQLLRVKEQNITPIFCIGETKKTNSIKQLAKILYQQLIPIKESLNKEYPIIIAYEPYWLIGTKDTPAIENIAMAIKEIYAQLYCYNNINIVYGGNVTAELIPFLQTISYCDGALIGRASLSFESFKNILSASEI